MREPIPPDDDTRGRIIDAAGPIFAQRGYDRATVRHICRGAGVNVASVGYYFGDKMGLYREVIRRVRSRREAEFPMPQTLAACPRQRLHAFVRVILRRMLACDDSGWEAQLMMREMQRPTEAFREMVEEYFRPLFERLQAILCDLLPADPPQHAVEQLGLSVIGQCLYYRFGREVIQQMIPVQRRQSAYDVETIARHITAVTLAAADEGAFLRQAGALPAEPGPTINIFAAEHLSWSEGASRHE